MTLPAITALTLQGPLGKALKNSCANRLKKIDYDKLVEPFRLRYETNGAWRCEFWGKIVRSAILTNVYVKDPELARIIDKTVQDMMATQTADGCISSYPAEKQCTGWDVWGRKYVLLTLLRYYDLVRQDPAVKECCIRLLDHLMTQVGEGRLSILEVGQHGGLASSSILGAVVGVYRISGEKRFLDFAEYIIASGCSTKHNIFQAVEDGVLPMDIGNGKAYEMTSCFQGMAELLQLVPDSRRQALLRRYFEAVWNHEIMITGVSGLMDPMGEYWFDGRFKQTRNDSGALGETCITATWLHYCDRIARLSDDVLPYEAAERSLYNAILGEIAPDGSTWIHANPTPLTGGGWKCPAPDQMLQCFGEPFDGHDCCKAQGPEGLAMAPLFAVTTIEGGASLNLFEPLTADFSDGTRLCVSGGYPYGNETRIRLQSAADFTLRLRIPAFCKSLTLNGKPLNITPSTFLPITRTWTEGDELVMTFDLSLKEMDAPDGSPYTAVMRGPLVLAEDSRGAVPDAPVSVQWKGRTLVDYATAGNLMREDNPFTVWFAK